MYATKPDGFGCAYGEIVRVSEWAGPIQKGISMFRKICFVGAAGAIALSPVLAQAETRGNAPIEGESAIGGQSPIVFLAGIAAVAAAIVFLSEDDDPVSP